MAKTLRTRARQLARAWRRRLRPLPEAPAWVQVEINNTCNLNCVMCPRQAMDRPLRHMTFEEVCDIADKCREARVPRLRLFLLGEPLLHPQLPDMIAYAKKIGIPSVEFNTNAALLSPSKADEIIKAGLDEIVFSLDGADKETYEAIRRGADFQQVTDNVAHFCRRREQRGVTRPRIIVQTIVMDSTRGQVPAFRRRWEPLADEVQVQCIREYHGVEGLRTTDIRPEDELRPCPALWEYLIILADLRVVPCCVDINGDMTLADITQTDMRTVWRTNDTLNRLRADHLRYDYTRLPLCAGCEFTNVSLIKRKAAEAALASDGGEGH